MSEEHRVMTDEGRAEVNALGISAQRFLLDLAFPGTGYDFVHRSSEDVRIQTRVGEEIVADGVSVAEALEIAFAKRPHFR